MTALTVIFGVLSIALFVSIAVKRMAVINADDDEVISALITKLKLTETSGLVFFSCAWHRRRVNADMWAEVWFAHVKNEPVNNVVSLFTNIHEEMSVDLMLLEPLYLEYAAVARKVIKDNKDTHSLGGVIKLLEGPYNEIFRAHLKGKEVLCCGG